MMLLRDSPRHFAAPNEKSRFVDGNYPTAHPQHVAPLALVDLAARHVSREFRWELLRQASRKRKASVTGTMRFRDRRRKAYSRLHRGVDTMLCLSCLRSLG